PHWFVTTMDLSPEAHSDPHNGIQRWVDSSISKTVNAPRGYTVEQVEKIYRSFHKGGAKGSTVNVDASSYSQVLTLTAEEDETAVHEENDPQDHSEQPVILMDTIQALEKTNVTIGSEVGDRCPVCREGHVAEIGGCNTCTSCGAQLKCGV